MELLSHGDSNSLMINIPSTQIERLQKIQNKAARMILWVPFHQHITPALQQLHWLPVRCCIKYKILVTVFKCMHALAHTHLTELLETRQRDRQLWNTDTLFLHQPMTRKYVGESAFCTAAPHLWNDLPAQIQSASALSASNTALKTYLFKQYFGSYWRHSITFVGRFYMQNCTIMIP